MSAFSLSGQCIFVYDSVRNEKALDTICVARIAAISGHRSDRRWACADDQSRRQFDTHACRYPARLYFQRLLDTRIGIVFDIGSISAFYFLDHDSSA